MFLIRVPSLKEINPQEGCFSLKVKLLNQCEEEEKYEEYQAIFRNAYLKTI